MSGDGTCSAYRDRLLAVAAEGEGERQRAGGRGDPRIAAHLAGCAACRHELGEWRRVAHLHQVVTQTAPHPSPAVLDGVWARLDAGSVPGSSRQALPGWLRHAAQLVAGQVPLVRRQIWSASALVMAVGAVFSALAERPDAAAGVLSLLAPVIAALGLALVYGPDVDPGLELALATPTSPRSVLFARMTLVFGYDLGLALLASWMVTAAGGEITWWGLVAQWLGPMALLASVALLLSVTFGPATAITAGLSLWTIRLVTLTDAGHVLAGGSVRAAVDAVWSTGAATLGLAAAMLVVTVVVAGTREWLT